MSPILLELRKLLQEDNLIIQACHEYPFSPDVAFWGGMGEVVENISTRLTNKGFNILVLPRQVKEYAGDKIIYDQKNGVYVLSIPIKTYQAGYDNKDLYNILPTTQGFTALDHCFTTWRYLEKHGLEKGILHSHDWLGCGYLREAKRKANIPKIFTVHLSTERNGKRTIDPRLELEKLSGSYADIIHYVSLHQMVSCQAYNWNHNKPQVIIPNGVDINRFKPPQESPLEEYILYVGRLTPVKNVPNLIKAWKVFNEEYPDVKLKILGASGTSNIDVQNTIRTLSQDKRSKVELRIEMVPLQERIKYLQNSTICCFPSSIEAFGIVSLEAQACGKPVVVGRTGGFKENALCGTTGVHVDGEKPQEIAEGLSLAYTNRKTWGSNARKLVEEFFSWDKIIDIYIKEFYKQWI